MALNTFSYRPLETARTIRLLDLQAGGSDDPVHFSLRHASLDEFPYYDALSYAWGDATDRRDVFINGAPTSVTVSLFSALKQFRYPEAGHSRTLWADAVCINQDDATEKTAQVQLMAHIYKTASQVIVWLGPSTEGVDVFFDTLPKAHDLISEVNSVMRSSASWNAVQDSSEDFRGRASAQRGEAQRRLLRFNWKPILTILLRSWFTRKWVIQEVGLARKVIMCAGSMWFDFNRLGDVVQALVELPVSTALLPSWSQEQKECLLNAYYLFAAYATRSNDEEKFDELLDLIIRTRQFKCTDARDNMYSLLSLANPSFTNDPALKPDYGLEPAQVYLQFATWELVHRQRPDILSLTYRPVAGTPSWIPDLESLETINHLGAGEPHRFSAGGNRIPGFIISQDQKLLKCRGKKVDTLSKFAYPIINQPLPNPEEVPQTKKSTSLLARQVTWRQIQWMKACERLAGEGDNMTDPDGRLTPERFEMFWRAMLCEVHVHGPGGRADQAMGRLFADYLETTYAIFSDLDPEVVRNYTYLALMIEPSIDHFSVHRLFCTTIGGRLGHVPIRSVEGDEVWVIQGVRVPFVVRRATNGSHSLVGECYLNGIMDGEALHDGTDFVDLALV